MTSNPPPLTPALPAPERPPALDETGGVGVRKWPFVAGLLGWLVPGLGHVYVGRPVKAALHFSAIAGLFGVGLWLTAGTAVDPVRRTLEFAAHLLVGAPAAIGLQIGEGRFLTDPPRWMETGRLFAAVAGLLNVVAVCDALGEVIAHNVRVEAARRRRPAAPVPPEVGLAPEEANGLASPADSGLLPPPPAATDRLAPEFPPEGTAGPPLLEGEAESARGEEAP